MAEPRQDVIDETIREVLRTAHHGYRAPSFDATWAAAEARLNAAGTGTRVLAGPRPGPRMTRWAALAAAVVLALGLMLQIARRPEPAGVEAPARENRAAALRPAPASRTPVIWYAPTDGLLQVHSLRYAAQPASLTYYDPIQLEVHR